MSHPPILEAHLRDLTTGVDRVVRLVVITHVTESLEQRLIEDWLYGRYASDGVRHALLYLEPANPPRKSGEIELVEMRLDGERLDLGRAQPAPPAPGEGDV